MKHLNGRYYISMHNDPNDDVRKDYLIETSYELNGEYVLMSKAEYDNLQHRQISFTVTPRTHHKRF